MAAVSIYLLILKGLIASQECLSFILDGTTIAFRLIRKDGSQILQGLLIVATLQFRFNSNMNEKQTLQERLGPKDSPLYPC